MSKALTEEVEDNKDGWSSWGQTLADLRTKAIELAIDGMKRLGSTLVDVGKQALDNYATFEQLEGGVKKMFGDDVAETVKQNANNAFSTAGMSANEYMETVTSFSASLISSLEGNTSEAAKISDMAIKDMSDNANTFGTNMQSIQNAYQGFSKQNYTMLDNLKLGYGGTKKEMERLLADAQKISGVKYNISSLSDVYNAIHVIQEEMKITGTTFNEASGTIEGSVNSMKAAWQNLLTGVADENSNFEELVSQFVDSVTSVASNILPRIKTIVEGLLKLIVDLIPKLLPQIIQLINEMLPQIINTVIALLPQIISLGGELLTGLIQGIAEALPDLIAMLPKIISEMVTTLVKLIPEIIKSGIMLLKGLIEGIIKAIPELKNLMPEVIKNMLDKITETLPKIVSKGMELLKNLTSGIINAIPDLVAKVPQIVKSFINGFGNFLKSDLPELGKNIIKGILQGLTNCGQFITNAVKEVGSKIKNGIKSFFGIKSPSTVMRDEVGTFLAEGIGVGFTKEMENVTKEMQEAIPTSFDTTIDAGVNDVNGFNYSNSYESMVFAFKEALSEMKIELNDEVAGKFVEKTVARAIYS